MRPGVVARHRLFVASLALAWAAGLGVASADTRDPAEGAREAASSSDVEALLLEQDHLLADEDLLGASEGRDPFEEWNRDVFAFNRRVDRWVFDPITRGYQVLVPEPGRRAVYRAFLNLDTPVVLANQMLQFRVVDAAGTTTRFVINSSVGLAGFFDPAAGFFEVFRSEADFGQTLARYGSPSGPYLVLPVFGPSTVRDVFGDVVDIVADPLSYLLGPLQWWTLALGGSEGLIVREARLSELRALEASSVDFYSALRSAYLQTRDAEVRAVRGDAASTDIVMLRGD